jgi:hypothetical protein
MSDYACHASRLLAVGRAGDLVIVLILGMSAQVLA